VANDKFIGDSGCVRLFEALQNNPHKLTLNLRGNCIGQQVLLATQCTTWAVHTLRLHDGTQGCEALAAFLESDAGAYVQALCLEWNALGLAAAGLRALSSVVAKHTHVRQRLSLHSMRAETYAGMACSSQRWTSVTITWMTTAPWRCQRL
jgi:hypothetical protein